MADITHDSLAGKAHPIHLDVRHLQLLDLQTQLSRPLTEPRLRMWAATFSEGSSILSGTVWGTIHWSKSIGRSLGPTLASGFSLEHWYYYMNWVIRGNGEPMDISKWMKSEPPSSWDLADEGDEFRVGYMCHAVNGWVNRLVVRFAEHQPWDSRLGSSLNSMSRNIVPPDQDLFVEEGQFLVLDDTTIVEERVRHVR